jgi:tRNA splicing ligase
MDRREKYYGKLYYATKGTTQGEYAQIFKDIARDKIDENIVREILEKYNVSLLFEVIDPIRDPHIVKYQDTNLVLLDAVYNHSDFARVPYEQLKEIGEALGVPVKKRIVTLYNEHDLLEFFKKVNDVSLMKQNHIEGYVLEFADGFQVKIKTLWYQYWKGIRGVFMSKKKKQQFMDNPTFVFDNNGITDLPPHIQEEAHVIHRFIKQNWHSLSSSFDNVISTRDTILRSIREEIDTLSKE